MKVFLIFIFNIIFCVHGKSQIRTEIPNEWKKESPKFKNQGEIEEYQAWQFFENEYQKTNFEKYEDHIQRNGNLFTFGLDKIKIDYYQTDLDKIFSLGIIYPSLFKNNLWSPISITDVEELKFLSTSKVKRFWFWLFYDKMHNPHVILFELENNNAKISTSMSEFIKGAKLTFLKVGWIII